MRPKETNLKTHRKMNKVKGPSTLITNPCLKNNSNKNLMQNQVTQKVRIKMIKRILKNRKLTVNSKLMEMNSHKIWTANKIPKKKMTWVLKMI